jgi:hypothetical protein
MTFRRKVFSLFSPLVVTCRSSAFQDSQKQQRRRSQSSFRARRNEPIAPQLLIGRFRCDFLLTHFIPYTQHPDKSPILHSSPITMPPANVDYESSTSSEDDSVDEEDDQEEQVRPKRSTRVSPRLLLALRSLHSIFINITTHFLSYSTSLTYFYQPATHLTSKLPLNSR